MDQVVQEILKRYRDYKNKLRKALIPPMPATFSLLLVSLAIPLSAVADPLSNPISNDSLVPYYGSAFYENVRAGERDEDLKLELLVILSSPHRPQKDGMDEIAVHCDPAGKDCYSHKPIGYKTARRVVMGELHLNDANGIDEVYCQREYTKKDFPSGPFPGPNVTPNYKVINVEHTWPQSRFNPSMNNGAQKSDLHHLFAADSEMNRIRGNMRFGEVDVPARTLPCRESKMGEANDVGGDFFEPPNAHKGNVARALFYFSIRYKMAIDPVEEAFLRKWHEIDPVDSAEMERNNQIQKIQGNRNPFIDFPELVKQISDF